MERNRTPKLAVANSLPGAKVRNPLGMRRVELRHVGFSVLEATLFCGWFKGCGCVCVCVLLPSCACVTFVTNCTCWRFSCVCVPQIAIPTASMLLSAPMYSTSSSLLVVLAVRLPRNPSLRTEFSAVGSFRSWARSCVHLPASLVKPRRAGKLGSQAVVRTF